LATKVAFGLGAGLSLSLALGRDARAEDESIPTLVERIYPNAPRVSPPPAPRSVPSNTGSNGGSNSSANAGTNNSPASKDDGPKTRMRDDAAWGTYKSRLVGGAFYSSGQDISRGLPGVTPGQPQTGNPLAKPARDFSRIGGLLEFAASLSNADIFDDAMLLGGEFVAQAAIHGGSKYSDGSYLKDPDDGKDKKLGFYLRAEAAGTLSPLKWGGAVPGRITAIVGGGVVLDGGRYYSDTYFLGYAGGRLSLGIGEPLGVNLQYTIAPFTTSSAFSLLEHRAEVSLNYRKYILGGRFGLDVVGEGETKASGTDKSLTTTTFSGFLGVIL
jgi:hypothetical protein